MNDAGERQARYLRIDNLENRFLAYWVQGHTGMVVPIELMKDLFQEIRDLRAELRGKHGEGDEAEPAAAQR